MDIKNIKEKIKENKNFLLILLGIVVIKSSVIDWSFVPTGSLRPTLLDGDQIIVNKLAYDVQVPLLHNSLYKIDDPKKNDIVVFDSKQKGVDGLRLVKRVLGVPGDHVVIKGNKLTINGKEATYKDIKPEENYIKLDKNDLKHYQELGFKGKLNVEYKNETIDNYTHKIRLETGALREVPKDIDIKIPENKYLMVGDNRNNSYDSRFWGLVDRSEVIGKANYVVFSLDKNNYYLPRLDRFFKKINQ